MSILNTNHSYGSVSKLFHWVIALLVFIMLALGYTFLFMDSGQNKLAVITLHKSIGLVVLFFVSLRLIWRLLNVQPSRSELSALEKVLVNSVQWLFYLALFVMPISGMIYSFSKGYPVSFFGLFNIPNIIEKNSVVANITQNVHFYISLIITCLIIVHTFAAFRHHFYKKDNYLKRILPFTKN